MAVSVTTLIGIITNVEMSVGPTGTAFTKASLGVSQGKDMNGDDKETMWFQIKAWGDLAENIAETYQNVTNQGEKSFRAVVTGKNVAETWEDTNGNKRSAVAVHVEDIGVSLRYAKIGSIQKSTNPANSAGKSAAFSQMKKASEITPPAQQPVATSASTDDDGTEVPF